MQSIWDSMFPSVQQYQETVTSSYYATDLANTQEFAAPSHYTRRSANTQAFAPSNYATNSANTQAFAVPSDYTGHSANIQEFSMPSHYAIDSANAQDSAAPSHYTGNSANIQDFATTSHYTGRSANTQEFAAPSYHTDGPANTQEQSTLFHASDSADPQAFGIPPHNANPQALAIPSLYLGESHQLTLPLPPLPTTRPPTAPRPGLALAHPTPLRPTYLRGLHSSVLPKYLKLPTHVDSPLSSSAFHAEGSQLPASYDVPPPPQRRTKKTKSKRGLSQHSPALTAPGDYANESDKRSSAASGGVIRVATRYVKKAASSQALSGEQALTLSHVLEGSKACGILRCSTVGPVFYRDADGRRMASEAIAHFRSRHKNRTGQDAPILPRDEKTLNQVKRFVVAKTATHWL